MAYTSHSFHIPPYPSLYTLLYSTISYRILFTIGKNDSEPKQLYYLGKIVPFPKLDRNDPGQNDPAESTQGRNDLLKHESNIVRYTCIMYGAKFYCIYD